MNIKPLYKQQEYEDISLSSYLTKIGISDPMSYRKSVTIEPTTSYDNIDKFAQEMRCCLLSTDKFYLLVDS